MIAVEIMIWLFSSFHSFSSLQVHTTGMDIKQAVDACAALTLGKDMVFRDYAQGAFRMRGGLN